MHIGLVFCLALLVSVSVLAGPRLEIYSGGSALLVEEVPEGERVEFKTHPIEDLFWETVYTTLMNEEVGTLEISCQIKLNNLSGQEFRDATVDLIAGEMLFLVGPPAGEEPPAGEGEVEYFEGPIPDMPPPPEEEPPPGESYGIRYFGSGEGSGTITPEGMMGPGPISEDEHYRYSLPKPVDIPQGEVFIPYMEKVTIPAQMAYRLAEESVVILVRFLNETGHPLPPSQVQIQGPDGTLMGEGQLDPASEDEAVELILGAVPGLSGERTRTDYRNFIAKNRCLESYAITIRSTRDEPVVVEILETLPGSDWEITASSLPYKVIEASQIQFQLSVPAQEEAEVSYTVEYTP